MIFTQYADPLPQESVFRVAGLPNNAPPLEVRMTEKQALSMFAPSSQTVHTLATALVRKLVECTGSLDAAHAELEKAFADATSNINVWGVAPMLAKTMCLLPMRANP